MGCGKGVLGVFEGCLEVFLDRPKCSAEVEKWAPEKERESVTAILILCLIF